MHALDPGDDPTAWMAAARRDPHATERALAAMPPARVVALIAAASTDAAAELLALTEDPGSVLAALPPVATARLAAADEDATLLRHVRPRDIVLAIDLDCRRRGRLSPSRFRAWLERIVATGGAECEAIAAALDPALIAAGIRRSAQPDEGLRERLRVDAYRGADSAVSAEDLTCDSEAIAAFLALLEASAPESLAAVVRLLVQEDAAAIRADDDEAYERRMRAAGLPDWHEAARSLLPSRRSARDQHGGPERAIATVVDPSAFLRASLVEAARGATATLGERLTRQMADFATRLVLARGGRATDETALAKAWRSAEDGLGRALAAASGGDAATAGGLLATRDLLDLWRHGRAVVGREREPAG